MRSFVYITDVADATYKIAIKSKPGVFITFQQKFINY